MIEKKKIKTKFSFFLNTGSVCTLDAKLKAVCACPNGFTGSKCDKSNFENCGVSNEHFC